MTAEEYFNKGNKLYYDGDLNGAMESYDKVIELDPDFIEVYCNRGNIKFELGDYNAAIEDYRKALKIKPQDEAAYRNLEEAYKMLESLD